MKIIVIECQFYNLSCKTYLLLCLFYMDIQNEKKKVCCILECRQEIDELSLDHLIAPESRETSPSKKKISDGGMSQRHRNKLKELRVVKTKI